MNLYLNVQLEAEIPMIFSFLFPLALWYHYNFNSIFIEVSL